MEAFRWQCEDDEEALGLATILERAGFVVEVQRDLHGGALVVADQAAVELTSKILQRYARAQEATRSKGLDRRERLGGLALVALCIASAIAGLLLWP